MISSVRCSPAQRGLCQVSGEARWGQSLGDLGQGADPDPPGGVQHVGPADGYQGEGEQGGERLPRLHLVVQQRKSAVLSSGNKVRVFSSIAPDLKHHLFSRLATEEDKLLSKAFPVLRLLLKYFEGNPVNADKDLRMSDLEDDLETSPGWLGCNSKCLI